ncbi:Peroxisomal targeting signal receptor [Termitomyces sp. T112]|nr:Peroxisomal targeting signal receptor [Termitomyces sp. T112]
MALSMLAGGAECGPSNPLQGLSKRFDQDRGLQQDHFGAGRASSSRETFRSTINPVTPDQDAARFFSANVPPAQLPPSDVYDVSALRTALPIQQQVHLLSPQLQKPSVNWAADFAAQQPLFSQPLNGTFQGNEVVSHPDVASSSSAMQQVRSGLPHVSLQWNPITNVRMGPMNYSSSSLSNVHQPTSEPSQISWDKEFSDQEAALIQNPPVLEQVQSDQNVPQIAVDNDELARTAGLLLENVRNEQNPKFQNSQFLNLMRKLRDRDIIVEGNQMVENEGQQTVDFKGKGRAIDPWSTSQMSTDTPQVGSVSGQPHVRFSESARAHLDEQGSRTEEDVNDAYFHQENAEYQQYWNNMHAAGTSQAPTANADVASWDRLQKDWDQFEATTEGIKSVVNYQFQDNNPYLVGDSSATRQHRIHAGYHSLTESVLQLEAAVQRDINNAAAWYELGVKQQENEREQKAFQALQRSLELDSSHLPTWLALGVSNTNESNRIGTFDAINEWVSRNTRYEAVVQEFRAQNPLSADASLAVRYTHLVDTLIAMARSNTTGIVDADTQIALAILLNTNEEYEKAHDCFLSALAVRPEDWLLYNRVGATMANSGRPEDALQYYYKALELNPGYIRARFNLGISCINLRRYEEAAQHILDALVFQDNDGVRDAAGLNETRGVTTKALWDSLKTTCLHMQRVDLATLCDRRDLEAFRLNFHNV